VAASGATLGAAVILVAAGDLRGQPALWAALAALSSGAAAAGVLVAHGRMGGRTVAALAVATCAGLCVGTPGLSDDVERYLWEGRAQRVELAAPYLMAPLDVGLPELVEGSRARVAHPEIPAAYPPLAEALCWLGAHLADVTGTAAHAFQCLMALFHLLTGLLLWRAAATSARARGLAAAYVLHPVALLEAPLGAHLDAAGGCLLLCGTLLARRQHWAAGVAWGASALVKPWAWLLLPWTLAWRQGRGALFAWGVTCVVLVAPYAEAGRALGAGLWQYASRWEFNAALYRLVFALVNPPFAQRANENRWLVWKLSTDGVALQDGGSVRVLAGSVVSDATEVLLDGRLVARGVCLGLLLLVLGWALRTHAQRVERVVLLTLLGLLAVSPTVHPWYALMVLPLCALAQAPRVMASLALLPLSYTVWRAAGAGVTWEEASWPAPLFLGVLAWAARADLQAWRSDDPPTQQSPAPSNT
jgi:hypothetical protein